MEGIPVNIIPFATCLLFLGLTLTIDKRDDDD